MKLTIRYVLLITLAAALAVVSIQMLRELPYVLRDRRNYQSVANGPVPNPTRNACVVEGQGQNAVRLFADDSEVRHIAFVKVHKAAGGSAASIFMRFGVTRGLTFVLPTHLNMISTVTANDWQPAIYPRLNKSFDIMTSHVIYRKTDFEKYLPEDTVYIGILRDPFQQFKSSMNYMHPDYVLNLSETSPVQEYLKDPLKYEYMNNANPGMSWLNNRQAVEFGFSHDVIMSHNMTAVDAYIRKLDKDFQLVIIAEYFDESVVLMRRMLNWGMRDILYRILHRRGYDRKITIPQPNDRRMYRKWAQVDYALYDFFYDRLWRQTKQAGSDFFKEVLQFKKVREEVDDFCRAKPNITSYVIPESPWNAEFEVGLEYCKLLYWEEEDFIAHIASIQYNVTTKKP